MGKQISTSSTAIGYYSKNWVESKIESTEDLIKVVKTKAYSNAIFKDGKRHSDNLIGFHDYLILDIDNDDTDFTIQDCESLFTSNNIASIIIPSKSHRKNKNGVICQHAYTWPPVRINTWPVEKVKNILGVL